uniref:N-terminal domain-containing protein n=1 Tax=viral metagenome TaxID=1070528 RepID=A0A6M3ITI8_9ZZZZ
MPTKKVESPQQALARIKAGARPSSNWNLIFTELQARGIPVEEIKPFENVLTFKAWLALGRVVKKGEHGVNIPVSLKDNSPDSQQTDDDPEHINRKRWVTAQVFHISQTKEIKS